MDEDDLARMNQVLRHRLRNLASGIKSAVSYLAKELDERLTPEELEYFPLIQNECDALSEMTSRMNLLFDSVPPGDPSMLRIVLERIRTDVRHRYPTTGLVVAADEACLAVQVSAVEWLLKALYEVVLNAAEAAPGKDVSIACLVENDQLRIRVGDEGPGIEEAQREEVFRPFYTTRTRKLGIGLPIARRCLDWLSGEIAVGAAPASGASFELVLPRSPVLNAGNSAPMYGNVP
jgi:signal transduction histidine kinase